MRSVCGGKSRCRRILLPVLRSWRHTPPVCRLVESDSDQKILVGILEWRIAGYMRRRANAAGKIVNTHLRPGFQGVTKADAATRWIHDDCVTRFRELGSGIEASYAQRNLRSHSRASPALRAVKKTPHTRHCKREPVGACARTCRQTNRSNFQ